MISNLQLYARTRRLQVLAISAHYPGKYGIKLSLTADQYFLFVYCVFTFSNRIININVLSAFQ